MFAGHKAFEGASALKVFAAIRHTEPPPIAALRRRIPFWSTSSDAVSRRILSGGGKASATSAASFVGSGKIPVRRRLRPRGDRSGRVDRLTIVATVAFVL
jgi:hypothetical protein